MLSEAKHLMLGASWGEILRVAQDDRGNATNDELTGFVILTTERRKNLLFCPHKEEILRQVQDDKQCSVAGDPSLALRMTEGTLRMTDTLII